MDDATAVARRPRRVARSDNRVEQQPGFVLHATPWRETSLILDALTRDHGRVALVARGAKRPTSQFRGMLAPFAPVALSWAGRGDIKSLVRADWVGGLAPLRGEGLLAAFYLNELLVRLLARNDPHPALFASYVQALHALAADTHPIEPVVRGFELDVLRDSGWLPPLDVTVDGDPVDADEQYRLDPERGPVPTPRRVDDGWHASGAALQLLAQRGADAAGSAAGAIRTDLTAQCRRLLRALIGHRLQGRPLNTRRILADLRAL